MTPNLTIGISLTVATAVGFACVFAHRWARHKTWPFMPRYITGAVFILIGYGFPLFATLPFNDALSLFMALILIYAGGAIGTFLAYDADPDPPGRTPDADRLIREIDEELRK